MGHRSRAHLRPTAERSAQLYPGPGVVFEHDRPHALDHLFEIVDVECVRVQGDRVEVVLDPGDPVERREEVDGRSTVLAALVGVAKDGIVIDRPLPIRTWQVWNEANFFYFAYPVSPVRYARLLKPTYNAIKSVDPGAQVVLSGLFGDPNEGGRGHAGHGENRKGNRK